jgi:hypothetical protein
MPEALLDMELDFVVLEQEDVPIPCDSEDCFFEAVWYTRCGSCILIGMACQACRDRVDSWEHVRCARCDEPMPMPLDWMPLK